MDNFTSRGNDIVRLEAVVRMCGCCDFELSSYTCVTMLLCASAALGVCVLSGESDSSDTVDADVGCPIPCSIALPRCVAVAVACRLWSCSSASRQNEMSSTSDGKWLASPRRLKFSVVGSGNGGGGGGGGALAMISTCTARHCFL